MARILTFDGMAAGTSTWYEDLDTGAIVQVSPGDVVPVRKINDFENYVNQGVATESGEEDGGDGQIDRVADALRTILNEVAPLEGDMSSWSLDDMIEQIQSLQTADSAAILLWTAPIVASTDPTNGATDVAVDAAIAVTFDKAMDPDSLASQFNVRGQDGALDVAVTSVALDEEGSTATLTLATDLAAASRYKIRVGIGVTNTAGNHLASIYVQGSGFTTAA